MKKIATILEEVPNTEAGLKWYIQLAEKEIKSCQDKIKELNVAVGEANERLKKIDKQRSGDEKTVDSNETNEASKPTTEGDVQATG